MAENNATAVFSLPKDIDDENLSQECILHLIIDQLEITKSLQVKNEKICVKNLESEICHGNLSQESMSFNAVTKDVNINVNDSKLRIIDENFPKEPMYSNSVIKNVINVNDSKLRIIDENLSQKSMSHNSVTKDVNINVNDSELQIMVENLSLKSTLHHTITEEPFELSESLQKKNENIYVNNSELETDHEKSSQKFSHPEVSKSFKEDNVNINVDGSELGIDDENLSLESKLHLAVRRDQFEVVKSLLEENVNINATAQRNITPIYCAAYYRNERMCELLLKNKADPNVSDKYGKSALHLAVEGFCYNIAALLLTNNANVNCRTKRGMTPLYLATKNEDKKMCELLLKFKADPDISDKYLKSSLYFAVERNLFEIASLLLENNADVDVKTRTCVTPLYLACARGNIEMCKLLLKFHADTNISDLSEKSPLLLAVEKNLCEIAEMLLMNNADVNKKTEDHISALQIAFQELHKSNYKNQHLCKLLILYGADVNISCHDGKSPLHLAIENDLHDLSELLLECGADSNQATRDKISPLYLAADAKSMKSCELLLKYGSIPIFSNQDKQSPFHLAIKNKCYQIAEMLLINITSAKEIQDYKIRVFAINGITKCFAIFKYGPETFVHLERKCDFISVFNFILDQFDGGVLEKLNDFIELAVPQHDPNFFCEIIKRFVDYGVFKFCAENVKDVELISAVISNGYSEILSDLLKQGLDINNPVNFSKTYSCTLLHMAVKFQRIDVARQLISLGAITDVVDSDKKSLFFYAARNADSVMIRFLLENFDSIDINKQVEMTTNYHCTVLNLAVKHGLSDVVAKLLTHKAEVHAIDSKSNSPLYYAVENGCLEIVLQLLTKTNVINCNKEFNYAVWLGNPVIVNAFLEHGYNVNMPNKSGYVALHCCVKKTKFVDSPKTWRESTQSKMVNILINAGANVNAELKSGTTALLMALTKNYLQVVETLLLHKVDVDRVFKQRGNCKPSIYTKSYGQYCLDKTVDPYFTALHIATVENNLKAVKLLLNYGASVNCQNEKGLTPLHISVLRENEILVEIFLKFGVNINSQNKQGTPAIHNAFIKQNFKIFTMLLEYGCDINISDKCNRTLFEIIRKETTKNHHFDQINRSQHAMIEYLQHHIVKLKSADLFLNETYLTLNNNLVSPNFYDYCQVEVTRMKQDYICGFSLSLYDVLTCSLADLMAYVKNNSFLTALKTSSWQKKYPIYQNMIYSKLLRAEHRKELQHEFEELFQTVFPLFFSLPELCKDKILENFTYKECRRLVCESKITVDSNNSSNPNN